ncbi:MAG: T9SS type A sorting domain-containing protein [Saprospiraceae bacterium]|nr:T9SS type A sorting domain-containing protein [Saprospiraceae bacterium]
MVKNHFTGSGIELIQVESGNYPTALGYFVDGTDAIGLQRGLVMSTGSVDGIVNHGLIQASSSVSSIDTTLQELEDIAFGALNDVVYLRITFKPFADSVFFRYVFGSEEYPEYACTAFNDVFGFFISGPNPDGGSYDSKNIALIPGTNLPVSINNLHPANPVLPSCPGFNEQYYVDNNGSTNQPVFDGFSTPFVAQARVVPCETYTILLAIADVGDSAFDSGVFLEAKSLESPVSINSTLPPGMPVIPEIATADTFSLAFTDVNLVHFPLEVTFAGSAVNGVDYQTLDSVYTIVSPTDILHVVIQPIQDALNESLESVILNIDGAATCFHVDYILYISDSDSLFKPVDTLFLSPGGTLVLSGHGSAIFEETWTFSNPNSMPIPNGGLPVESVVAVDLPFTRLDDIAFLDKVCVNIQHEWAADLDFFLVAPNQSVVELSSDNGENGDHYIGTCFSPSATQEIRGGLPYAPASAAPFTGTYLPEGLWTDLIGTPLNGIWKLVLKDDQNGTNGLLENWSISFSTAGLDDFQYLWSTGDTTPTINVSTPGIYHLEASNAISHYTQTFVVQESTVSTHNPEQAQAAFQLFPNPSNGEVMVQLRQPDSVLSLKVYDLGGTCLLQQSGAGTIHGAAQLPKGVYFVTLESTEGIFTQKLVRW